MVMHVRCNNCNHEYNIYSIDSNYKEGVGRHILREDCSNCGIVDYIILEKNLKVKYSDCHRDCYFDKK